MLNIKTLFTCRNNPINIPQMDVNIWMWIISKCTVRITNYSLLHTAWLDQIWHLWIGLTFTVGLSATTMKIKRIATGFWCKTNCTVVLAVYFTLSCHNRAWVNEVFHCTTLMKMDFDGEEQLVFFFFYSVSYPIKRSVPATLPPCTLTCLTSKKWISLIHFSRFITIKKVSLQLPERAHTLHQDISSCLDELEDFFFFFC